MNLGELRRLGLGDCLNQEADGLDLQTLRTLPPGLVIAEACCSFGFGGSGRIIRKKTRHVLNAASYEALNDSGRRQRGSPVLKPDRLQFSKVYRPYRGDNLAGRTILFMRTGGCGDLLFLNPLLRHLKERWPTCRIKFASGAAYQSMLAGWPWIDEVLSMPLSLSHFLKADYHAIFEGVIERCREAHTINAYELFAYWLNLRIPADELRPLQKPALKEVHIAREVLTKWGLREDNFILVQMRASSPIRSPNPGFWQRLLGQLRGYPLVLTDEPRYAEAIDKLLAGWGNPPGIYNYARHSNSFSQAISLASLSRLVLATDSALLHIGASVGKRVFGIYGPFPGRLRLATYPGADWVDAPADCAPCFTHGHDPCRHAGRQCFDNIDLEATAARIGELYERQLEIS